MAATWPPLSLSLFTDDYLLELILFQVLLLIKSIMSIVAHVKYQQQRLNEKS